MEDLDEPGEPVRHRRLALELCIDDAAHACGVAANVLSRRGNGKPVGADRLLRVLSGLGLATLVTSKEEAISYQPPQTGAGVLHGAAWARAGGAQVAMMNGQNDLDPRP